MFLFFNLDFFLFWQTLRLHKCRILTARPNHWWQILIQAYTQLRSLNVCMCVCVTSCFGEYCRLTTTSAVWRRLKRNSTTSKRGSRYPITALLTSSSASKDSRRRSGLRSVKFIYHSFIVSFRYVWYITGIVQSISQRNAVYVCKLICQSIFCQSGNQKPFVVQF